MNVQENIKEENTENIEKVKKKKKNNLEKVIIIILIIIIMILGGIIFTKKNIIFNTNSTTKNQNTKKENTKDTEKTNTETKETIEDNKTEETTPLDLTKCLNCEGNWTFSNQTENDSTNHFSISNNNNNLTLSINWNTFCPLSGTSSCPSGTLYYEIRGINKKIKKTIIGGSGQSIESTTLYYLLEDGTVEYTKLYNQKKDGYGHIYYEMNFSYDYGKKDSAGAPTTYFASQGPVSGLSNIINLYNVQVHSNEGVGSGWATTIGATANGSFYDLKV